MKSWPLYRPALAADALINTPVVKHHGLAKLTAGMKNLMGIMGGNRGRVHRELSESLVDLNIAVPSTLTVIDATRILTANGPQGGGDKYVTVINKVAASEDKDFIAIEGAVHGITPCTKCMPEGEEYDGRYDNSVKNYFDYVAAWINERF